MKPLRNALTCDVEDYFQVSAFDRVVPRGQWPHMESRIERNVDRVLELFGDASVKATFFTLGWIAGRYPQLVRRIAGQGHEIASHGYGHFRASEQDIDQFDNDIRSSKAVLEDICGQPVLGYRAPSFSIGERNLWAFDRLAAAGYAYSSSIYPVVHDHYGMPSAPRFAFRPYGDSGLLEVPVSTVRIGERNLPAGGGGYFRLLPYSFSRWMLGRINQLDGMPAVFYFHPWELDPGQPRPAGASIRTRFRHYVNLHRTEERLRALTRDFAWDRMDRIYLGRGLHGH